MDTFTNTLDMNFTQLPPGEFLMGLDSTPEESATRFGGAPDWYIHEQPRHRVKLTRGFSLATTQVTRSQFAHFVNATSYITQAEAQGWSQIFNGKKFTKTPEHHWQNPGFEQTGDHPVVCVSFSDALAFCDWLSKTEGRRFRLPTEAEWEYAYRAVASGAYTWGDDPEAGAGWANAADQTAKESFPDWTTFNWTDGFVYTAPVASFRANAWGLFDMPGNAWEWCADWFSSYMSDDAIDPIGPATGEKRILRGGSWYGAPLSCRAAYRSRVNPTYRGSNAGFRVAMEL